MTDSNDFHPETLLCFTAGVSAQDIEKATQVFNEADSGTVALHAVAVSPSLLGMPVGTALEGLRAGIKPPDFDVSVPGPGECRVVLVDTASRDRIISVMRSFKAVLKEPGNLIFAVITETARNWTFEDYFSHLIAEHEFMKNRKLENDPDMKKL